MTPPTKVKPQVIGQNFGPFIFPSVHLNGGFRLTGELDTRLRPLDSEVGVEGYVYGGGTGVFHSFNVGSGLDTPIELRGSVVRIVGNNNQLLWYSTPTEVVFNEPGNDLDFRVEAATGTHALFIEGSGGNIGINTSSPIGKVHILDGSVGGAVAVAGANQLVIENSVGAGMTIFGGTGSVVGINFGDVDSGESGKIRYSNNNDRMTFNAAGASQMRFDDTVFEPSAAAGLNLGDAAHYWDDVSYKTLTDRGCLGWYDDGVEMPDGSIVGDMEAIKLIQKHPTLLTQSGQPRLDYASMPVHVYKPAPIAEDDIYNEETHELEYKKGEKHGEDGAELTALFSIVMGAVKELDSRLEIVENG